MTRPALRHISQVSLITHVLLLILGIGATEVWYLSRAISFPLSERIHENNVEGTALEIVSVGFILLFGYLAARGIFSRLKIILKSKRLELLVPAVFGVLISYSFNGIGGGLYSKIASSLNIFQLVLLAAIPFVIIFLFLLDVVRGYFQGNKKQDNTSSFFINDEERENPEDDQLNYNNLAEKFAERVLNRGSKNSMVFGIDAPWGMGKSTFINFCKKYWEKNNRDQIIVYSFNPIRYEERNKLIEKFVDGLTRTIQRESFVPEIRPLLSKYSRLLSNAKYKLSFYGFDFEWFSGAYTIDDAFKELESALSRLDRKIIIIVDDLDRLNYSSVKDVLFVINKSFSLPNISYVLCYDTENIGTVEGEGYHTEKISEFFEKFVNVKITLCVDPERLEKFITENQKIFQRNNLQASPILVGKAIGGLKDIFKSKEYYKYLPFIGDLRKLKRLINTVMLLEIENTDFDNNDINKDDLIRLLLIYVNYPTIFRKIFDTETQGKRGFFSVVAPYDTDDYPKEDSSRTVLEQKEYKNSNRYNEYLDSLSGNQQFLLNSIFKANTKLPNGARIDSVTEEIATSNACFNGGSLSESGRNLEAYLNLIVSQSKPEKYDQHKYYVGLVNKIKSGTQIQEIFNGPGFEVERGEVNHERLWRAVLNSLYDFNGDTGRRLIEYVLSNLPDHSFLENKGVLLGFRDELSLYLTKLLDTAGWVDQDGEHRENTTSNIKEIADWVFGEGAHADMGVIEKLAKEDRGVLGLYDLLCFRLFCSADRGGDIFNLTRAIALHGNPQAPSEGSTQIIAVEEMRELSQKVAQLFKERYIDTRKNILTDIDELEIGDMTGIYHDLVQTKIREGMIQDIDAVIGSHRARLKSFITYQLGNSDIHSGIGCGYYDLTGSGDKKGIKDIINNYLFDVCFNPEVDSGNYERFIDYLMINFATTFSRDERKYIPHINEFTKILSKERLTQYWSQHHLTVKGLNLTTKDKNIYHYNYTTNYNEDLQTVFDVLDKLLNQPKSELPANERGESEKE